MKLPSKFEWVIGLHSYRESPPPSEVFASFYAAAMSLFVRLGLTMTHIAAEGDGHSGKLVKASSAAAKRLLGSGFSGIAGLSCVVSPEGSKEPAYDRLASVDLSWNSPTELLLCVVVNDGLNSFLSPAFDATLAEMLEIENWSFGYAFRDTVDRQPDFHVLALDNGRLSKAESQALRKWYASKASERIERPRNVYPITILNERQLSFSVNGSTLMRIIEETFDTTTSRVGALVVWRVPEDQIQRLRDLLSASGALIT
jgi:hypothetical protein